MKNSKVNEIKNRMTAFKNDKYTRDELISEFFKLQDEMATIAFGNALSDGKRFYDISDYLSDKNNSKKRISAEMMEAFRKECGEATNRIRAEVSGRKGENRAFYKLDYLLSRNCMRKNVEISEGNKRTEIDALVVTEKAAFIIEVKNTKRDIFIDEYGQYYRTGEFLKWDTDLGSKLALRETFVREAAENAGIKNIRIVKVVVFTDNRIRVQNKCKEIRTCFLNQLTSVIDTYTGAKSISPDEMNLLMNTVDEMTTNTGYAPDMDIEKFKNDFAEIVAAMEDQKKEESKPIIWRTWKAIISSITLRKAASFLLTVGTIGLILGLH